MKKLRKALIGLCIFSFLTFGLYMEGPKGWSVPFAHATVTEIGTHTVEDHKVRTILVDDTMYGTDYRDMLAATRGEFDVLYIKINTTGGSVGATLGIINEIKDMKQKGILIVTEVQNQALSAGAMLFVQGDIRIVHKGDTIMFHNAHLRDGTYGQIMECPNETYQDACDHIARINNYARQLLLDILKDTELVNKIYSPDQDNFLTAEEAFELGIATHYKK
jgi:ATP-dependent protease ClpP protease subunit